MHRRNDQAGTVVIPANNVLDAIDAIEVRQTHGWTCRTKPTGGSRAQIEQIRFSSSRIGTGIRNQIGIDRVDVRR